ncbi:hypothetical protein TNCV_2723981 [Trichonephila clavipes]|nr:hypothetical protein TNCV_2723981 [Trichonephila clavipes]
MKQLNLAVGENNLTHPLNSKTKTIAGEKQLNSAGENNSNSATGTKQLNSVAGMKQLDSAPPAPPLQQNQLFLSTPTPSAGPAVNELEKPGEREEKKERTRKRRKKSSETTRAGRFRKRRGESQSFLFGDADQESETRMSKNALRTGRRQAVE